MEELLWVLDGVPLEVGATVDNRGSDVDINSAVSLSLQCPDSQVTVSIGVCGGSSDLLSDERVNIWGEDGRIRYTSDRRGNPISEF